VQTALPVVLEERAALAPNAQVEAAGRCPHCGSEGAYLEKEVTQPEVRSLYGPVVLTRQHARCRSCGGSFSPSGSGVGIAGGSSADPLVRRDGFLRFVGQAGFSVSHGSMRMTRSSGRTSRKVAWPSQVIDAFMMWLQSTWAVARISVEAQRYFALPVSPLILLSISLCSGNRPTSCLLQTSLSSTCTSNTPPEPSIILDSTPNAFLSASARPAAVG